MYKYPDPEILWIISTYFFKTRTGKTDEGNPCLGFENYKTKVYTKRFPIFQFRIKLPTSSTSTFIVFLFITVFFFPLKTCHLSQQICFQSSFVTQVLPFSLGIAINQKIKSDATSSRYLYPQTHPKLCDDPEYELIATDAAVFYEHLSRYPPIQTFLSRRKMRVKSQTNQLFGKSFFFNQNVFHSIMVLQDKLV